MSKHDYSIHNITNISQSLNDCSNVVENTCLFTELMPYSWDTGIIHNVVTWIEVLQVNSMKGEIARLFKRANGNLENTNAKLLKSDQSAALKINAFETDMKTVMEGLDMLNEYLEDTIPNLHL